ncbi:keratin-associated protein 27-1 [Tupaia chinensis]|uniref:Keratin-associated protein n=1 Tax=Tupaia chinensis TaxID=246437 RepID=L9K9W6_TUPCH|nr:keratin-associated protein 27-1 [Tupaia chinensis]ELW59443.1 Keratin-associated protein 27-1 [Tupaia chinensis]
MPHSDYHSLRAPPLSAIEHGSSPTSFEDGFCLPSSCYSRTWLLDNFQDTWSEATSCQVTNCEQDRLPENSCVQNTCLSRVVQTTYSNSRPCEKTTCISGQSSAALECVSQPGQAGSSQQKGFIVQRCQPASYLVKYCPPKTSVSKNCQTLECESSQCQSQSPESSSCRTSVNVAPGPQLLVMPNTYEPTCCVTGGLQLP